MGYWKQTITIDGVTLSETIGDTVGGMVSSNTETGITVTYDDSDNTLDFVIGTLNQDTTGNTGDNDISSNRLETLVVYHLMVLISIFLVLINLVRTPLVTLPQLETARTIGGVSFDGTGDINLPGVNQSGNQNTSGNALRFQRL